MAAKINWEQNYVTVTVCIGLGFGTGLWLLWLGLRLGLVRGCYSRLVARGRIAAAYVTSVAINRMLMQRMRCSLIILPTVRSDFQWIACFLFLAVSACVLLMLSVL